MGSMNVRATLNFSEPLSRFLLSTILITTHCRDPPDDLNKHKNSDRLEDFTLENKDKNNERKIFVDGELVEVSEEIYKAYTSSKRKERYLEQDIKRNRIVYYKKTGAVRVIPSREDSLERLMEDNGRQFFIDQEGVEEAAQRHMDIEALRLAVSKLSEEDRRLIYEEFFRETSQEEIGRLLDISQSAVSRRKKRILEKLKKLLEKYLLNDIL